MLTMKKKITKRELNRLVSEHLDIIELFKDNIKEELSEEQPDDYVLKDWRGVIKSEMSKINALRLEYYNGDYDKFELLY